MLYVLVFLLSLLGGITVVDQGVILQANQSKEALVWKEVNLYLQNFAEDIFDDSLIKEGIYTIDNKAECLFQLSIFIVFVSNLFYGHVLYDDLLLSQEQKLFIKSIQLQGLNVFFEIYQDMHNGIFEKHNISSYQQYRTQIDCERLKGNLFFQFLLSGMMKEICKWFELHALWPIFLKQAVHVSIPYASSLYNEMYNQNISLLAKMYEEIINDSKRKKITDNDNKNCIDYLNVAQKLIFDSMVFC